MPVTLPDASEQAPALYLCQAVWDRWWRHSVLCTSDGGQQWTVSSDQRPSDRVRYASDRRWLTAAVHELPAGVLWGAGGATPEQCAEMMDGLDEFARVCDRLGLADQEDFVAGCRWHFEHYPHYLGRRRHFVDYAAYIRDRRGPERVALPPDPAWLRGL